MKKTILFFFLVVLAHTLTAQVDKSSELFQIINTQDSLLFDVGFNTCDISQFENIVSDDFDFYHDQAGLTSTKSAFVASIRDGLCTMEYKAIRKLDTSSMKVFALKKNDVVYGAIQEGVHRFYALEKDKPEYFTSVARFTNVWLLENDEWKLSKSLSYDHQVKDREEGIKEK